MTKGYIGDIHANLEALRAVLKDMRSKGIKDEDIVFLGDLIGYGPDPLAVIDEFMALGIKYKVPGNHDERGIENAERLIQGKLFSATDFGEVAYGALRKHLDALLTKNPKAYFSDDWIAKQTQEGMQFPAAMVNALENIIDDSEIRTAPGIMDALRTYAYKMARKEAPLVGGLKKGTINLILNAIVEHVPELQAANQAALGKVAERKKAKQRLEYMRELANGDKMIIVDGDYCFHSSIFGNVSDAYLLDPVQIQMGRENNVKPISGASSIADVVDYVKNRKPGRKDKIDIAKGHTHRPSLYEAIVDGVKVRIMDPGGAMPRILNFEGVPYHDKVCWIEREGDNAEMHKVTYDWEATDKKMVDKGLPRNQVWKKVREAA